LKANYSVFIIANNNHTKRAHAHALMMRYVNHCKQEYFGLAEGASGAGSAGPGPSDVDVAATGVGVGAAVGPAVGATGTESMLKLEFSGVDTARVSISRCDACGQFSRKEPVERK
jgi:hypothetical protein